MGHIVVGVDGSEGSRHALLWAADEATLRGATLDVIHVYAPPEHTENIGSAEQARSLKVPRESAQALVDDLIGRLDSVEAEGRAIESDSPARALVEESKGADMLVVSSRGLGSFKSLMLGSISQQCAHHAECPVVIIRSQLMRPIEPELPL